MTDRIPYTKSLPKAERNKHPAETRVAEKDSNGHLVISSGTDRALGIPVLEEHIESISLSISEGYVTDATLSVFQHRVLVSIIPEPGVITRALQVLRLA